MRYTRKTLFKISLVILVSILVLHFLQEPSENKVERLQFENDFFGFEFNSSRICLSQNNISVVSNATFIGSEPRQVIILTYQRAGSTFFGDMFNHNPEAFYVYEPLDAMYAAMYGTLHGWNVPSDITNNDSGELRIIPKTELDQVSQFIQNLLECDVKYLPTSSLVHPFMFYNSGSYLGLTDYIKCLSNNSVDKLYCDGSASHYCGARFGEQNVERMDECVALLKDNFQPELRVTSSAGKWGPQPPALPNFIKFYKTCMADARHTVENKCISLYLNACESHQLRVIKTVRATMKSMSSLLKSLPNLRIVHLIRDPRAVALSRIKFHDSAMGFYSRSSNPGHKAREARLYCNAVVQDIKVAQVLKQTYPGRILTVRYEDMVRDTKLYANMVYRFIGIDNINNDVAMWIQRQRIKHRRFAFRKEKWIKELTEREKVDIQNSCEEFLQLLNC